ncbi:p53 and DNA damage-regulated protein 1-like isoform X2 [Odontomachus brunneus]|uniref:p53 and DNA damage-regulated protein 1-like isoform X2 n=1 Tax=Odontomachus brunneus TaxID=486640 RepID=UPI0013F2174B|nr:p53 and DNA damage-regulated protein 1-like isoform X2 [Odontomachus brunneus]
MNLVQINMSDHEKILEHLEQVEYKAGEILTDLDEIVALDKRRNDNRVGMKFLEKEPYKKTWITIGEKVITQLIR